MLDVVALGELLIDFAAVSTDSDGYPTVAAHPGGAPANFLAAVNQYGGKTALIGKVGNDAFGHLLLGTLEKSGIDISGMKITDDFFTTLAFVTFDEQGDRSFSFSRKPGADTQLRFDEIDSALIESARALHIGTLSLTHEPARTATVKAVEYAKACGKLITCDPNLRKPLWPSREEAKQQMLWSLQAADVVKISDDEVKFLLNMTPEQGARHILEQFDCRLVFVTCGADGCVYANRNAMGHVPGLHGLHVIDTCGAGDIFGGSAVWGLLQSGKQPEELEDEDLRRIVRYACTAAGLSTERSGGISSIPSREEVQRRMQQEFPTF